MARKVVVETLSSPVRAEEGSMIDPLDSVITPRRQGTAEGEDRIGLKGRTGRDERKNRIDKNQGGSLTPETIKVPMIWRRGESTMMDGMRGTRGEGEGAMMATTTTEVAADENLKTGGSRGLSMAGRVGITMTDGIRIVAIGQEANTLRAIAINHSLLNRPVIPPTSLINRGITTATGKHRPLLTTIE